MLELGRESWSCWFLLRAFLGIFHMYSFSLFLTVVRHFNNVFLMKQIVNGLSGWVNWSKLALLFLLSSSSSYLPLLSFRWCCFNFKYNHGSQTHLCLSWLGLYQWRIVAWGPLPNMDIYMRFGVDLCVLAESALFDLDRWRSCCVLLCWLVLELWMTLSPTRSYSFGCNLVQLSQIILD